MDKIKKKAKFQLHVRKIADKMTAYNEGRLYQKFQAYEPANVNVVKTRT